VLGGSSLEIKNCIIWGNSGAPLASRVEGGQILVGYSFLEGSWAGNFNQDLDPRFVAAGRFDFGNYEGEVPAFETEPADFHLSIDSPAIDQGDNRLAPIEDIEGNARPCGPRVDPGAYEAGSCGSPPQTIFIRGDCNGDGRAPVTVTDAIFLLNYNFLCGKAPPCLAACDANTDGEVVGSTADAIFMLHYNFMAGPVYLPPFPECGPGQFATDAILGCGKSPKECE
jgi:hypothetical protein